MLKRDFSDIVYRALANYFDVQTINSNIKRTGKKLVYVNASSYTTVPAGSYEVIVVQPPEGKVWRIVHAFINITPPSGATTGSHSLLINPLSSDGNWRGVLISASYSAKIHFSAGGVFAGTPNPNDVVAFTKYIREFLFSYDNPLYLRYSNGTDVDQSSARVIELIVEEFDEVS